MTSSDKTRLAEMWSETKIAGHDSIVFEPEEPSRHGYTVIYLHGVHLGDLRNHPRFAEQFQRHGLRVVAPVTGRSWWTDRICEEFDAKISAEQHILQNVLPEIESRWGVKPPQIALLGTSMGGQGALRFAFKYPDLFPIVAGIAPAIDYQNYWDDDDGQTLSEMYPDPEAARQDTATLHIHPLYWPRNTFFCCDPADHRWFESSDRLHMKLYSLGVPHEVDLETSAGGHGFDYYCAMAPAAIGFLAERLERERLRVV